MTELIHHAIKQGGKIYASISGGKDGQAMVRTLMNNKIPVTGLLHCDLGRTEWPQSIGMCERQQKEYKLPLYTLRRKDGLDLFAYWERRMNKLLDTGKPFWSSAVNRYCTSDLKRLPSDQFFRDTKHGLIISAEGVRAQESTARAKKLPLSIRKGVTSTYYDNMTVADAISAYRPDKRLVLTWYPVFNMELQDVWESHDTTLEMVQDARGIWTAKGIIPKWWEFHPAYAMGNERVSCMICILGSLNDIQNGAKQNPELLRDMVRLEKEGKATFRQNLSLQTLLSK